MSLLEMLQKRHSIRKYTDADISDQDLQTILQAGLLSASGRAAVSYTHLTLPTTPYV